MSSKDSSRGIILPYITLPSHIVYLPGVTYRTTLPLSKSVTLLNQFINTEGIFDEKFTSALATSGIKIETGGNSIKRTLSDNAKEGVLKINELFAPLDSIKPVIVCLPNHTNNVGTICLITGVQIIKNKCVLVCRGIIRAFYNELDVNEGFFEILDESKNKQVISNDSILHKTVQLFEDINNFLAEYAGKINLDKKNDERNNDEGKKDQVLKNIFLRLSPLVGLLYLQLVDTDVLDGFKKLAKAFKFVGENDGDKFLKYFDVLVALFPFSFEQKVEFLSESNTEARIKIMDKLLSFTHKLFGEFLNLDYLLDNWKNLDAKNGEELKSKFITSHLRDLKLLLGEIKMTPNVQNDFKSNQQLSFKNREDDNDLANIENFMESINQYEMSEDGKSLLLKDFRRLKNMQSSSSEYQQLRNYLDVIIDLPWMKKTYEYSFVSHIDLPKCKETLDSDHFGMESVKERILEYLAILKLNQSPTTSKAPILLLNGPPGVGKTSLARSIANALDCKFQRISLGGVSDFADLKGHRRTYVGAIPGLIIQSLRRAQSMNPVILLDEIDKIGTMGNKGNPEAALLEVLDPEQNANFMDHYVGFPVDLSKVLFIATSNDQWELSVPLRDRMEVIDLQGYTFKEKVEICKRFVVPRQCNRNGLKENMVVIADKVIERISLFYTRESGVRNLERLIGKICRKKAVEFLNSPDDYESEINLDDLVKYLGVPVHLSDSDKFSAGRTALQENYGIVNGMSYNSDGSGSLLKFEMVGLPGNQGFTSTGRLGEVIIESSEIADTLVGYVINNKMVEGYDGEELIKTYKNTNVHMHVPEGSISKDGPSAGITMTLCYLSLLLGKSVPSSLAMTGEITLTGKVLPIGGLKEKLLGAHLSGEIDTVIVPRLNRKDVIEDYASSISNRLQAKQVLTRLIKEEEQCLSFSKRYSFDTSPEDWVKNELGIDVHYVDDFADVVHRAWNNSVRLIKPQKSHL